MEVIVHGSESRGDDTTAIGRGAGNDVEGHRRAEVDDNRRWGVMPDHTDGIRESVCTNLCRMGVVDAQGHVAAVRNQVKRKMRREEGFQNLGFFWHDRACQDCLE